MFFKNKIMRIETEERDQSNKPLDYVFGVVQKPGSRGQNLIFGWDGDGNPALAVKTLAQEDNVVTHKGYETRGRNTVLEFPLETVTKRSLFLTVNSILSV